MTLKDFFTDYKAQCLKTETALATANTTISQLSAKLAALEAAAQIKADDDTADADESTEIDQLISDLQKVLNTYKSKDADSDDSSDSDDSTDSSDAPDDSDTSDDEAKAKASKVEKLKSLTATASQLVAEAKEIKASVPKQVIKEIAAIGIPTPVATKPDSKATALKGLDRVAAAFAEQINQSK